MCWGGGISPFAASPIGKKQGFVFSKNCPCVLQWMGEAEGQRLNYTCCLTFVLAEFYILYGINSILILMEGVWGQENSFEHPSNMIKK